ncbi:MAG: AAA family ATPase [Clostridia bacterium]|nr:AAA family ATPase [Clostridia bacterium]
MERLIYEKLVKWKNEEVLIPLMVIGARQIGKTYIIKEFCEREFSKYIYVNLKERQDIVSIFENDGDNYLTKMQKFFSIVGHVPEDDEVIFFDEVQESETLISLLKAINEDEHPYKVVCAGSLLGVRLKRMSTSFPVGKVRMINMYPMTFEEFLMNVTTKEAITMIEDHFKNNEALDDTMHKHFLKLYRDYLVIGGMPESVKNYIENDKDILRINRNILSDIIDSYKEDMTKYVFNKFEANKIRAVYESISSQLAKENKKFKYSMISSNARSRDYETAFDWLVSSGLIIPSYSVSECVSPLKASMNKDSFKVYFNDVGLLLRDYDISLSKILFDEDFRAKGAITENYVMSELVANGNKLYYYQVNQVCEIDAIIESAGRPIPIEVKSGENKKSRSLNYYREKFDPDIVYRISQNNFGIKDDIKSIPLYAVFCIKKDY